MSSQASCQGTLVNVWKNVLALPGRKHFNHNGHTEISGVLIDLGTGLPISEGFLAYKDSYSARIIGDRVTESEVDAALKNAYRVSHSAYYAGFFFSHYGHFLLESLNRVMPILLERDSSASQVRHKDLYYFSQWGAFDFTSSSLSFSQIFQGLGIDPRSLHEIKCPMVFSELKIPIQTGGLRFDYEAHSRIISVDTLALHRELFKSFSLTRFAEPRRQEYHDKIYVSRSGLPARNGKFLLEKLLEDILNQYGWHIYHPEQHSLAHQIGSYQSAKRIVFAEGSSLYSLLLMKSEQSEIPQNIFVILRRSSGAGLLNDIRLINPELPLMEPIDAIILEELFGANDWNSYSVLDFGGLLERLNIPLNDAQPSAKSISSEQRSVARIIANLDSDMLCRAILSISRYSTVSFSVALSLKDLSMASNTSNLLPEVDESDHGSIANLISANHTETISSAIVLMARSISLPSDCSSHSPKSPISSSVGNHERLCDPGRQSMSKQAARQRHLRAVIAAHPLESHEAAAWLHYGVALSQLIEPSAQERQKLQQVGLAFAHAEALGASKEAVALSKRKATLLSLAEALEMAGAVAAATALLRKAGWP